MKHYIFFTQEGNTFDPFDQEVSNMQILGTGDGGEILEAFKNFKNNQSYLLKYSFKEVLALEYVGEIITNLEL